MLRYLSSLILLTLLWPPCLLAAETLAIGETLPAAAGDLVLDGVDGTAARLADLRGARGLLVIFSSNTCPYVLDWLDRYPTLAAWGQEHDIGIVVVNSNERKRAGDDSPEAMAELARERFPEIPYLVDEDSRLADLLGATRTPEAYLFDGELELVYRGLIDDRSGPLAEVEEHFLADALGALLTGGPFPEPTAAVGCAILRPRRRSP